MKRLITYVNYFIEYLKFRDYISIGASVRYLLFKKSHQADRIVKTSIGTFFCRKNTNDFQFANLRYEWEVKKFIINRISDFNVFIDGGACVGEYSILLSRYKVRCIAFEPIISNYNTLLKNLELNNLAGVVKAFPFGLGEKNSKVNYVFNPVNTGASYLEPDNSHGPKLAEVRTFDSLLPQLDLKKDDHILFKLDVEGMEPEAIRGAREFIWQYPHITFVMEDKHAGKESIWASLNKITPFEFCVVDTFNICAKKVNGKPLNF